MQFTEKHIDLAQYGGEGEVVVGPQSLRAKTRLVNEISRRTIKVTRVDGEVVADTLPIDSGDIELLQILSYVRKAPFDTGLDSFLEYCDRLDENSPGAGISLAEAMKSAAEEVVAGPTPLDS